MLWFQDSCSCQGGEGKRYSQAARVLFGDEGSEWIFLLWGAGGQQKHCKECFFGVMQASVQSIEILKMLSHLTPHTKLICITCLWLCLSVQTITYKMSCLGRHFCRMSKLTRLSGCLNHSKSAWLGVVIQDVYSQVRKQKFLKYFSKIGYKILVNVCYCNFS